MVGYNESLTDPSYRGQILVLTFPLIGNYGVPSRQEVEMALNNLPRYFESNQIHIAALIVGRYDQEDYSHYLAKSSLSKWLVEYGVPALYGLDTRALTKKIREQGVMLGKVLFPKTLFSFEQAINLPMDQFYSKCEDVEWVDPNNRNLVAEVSTKKAILYQAETTKVIKKASGQTLTVLAVDVGMKFNQIRCFTSRGVDVKVVPWDYDFTANPSEYDGLFISNGPGDPTVCSIVIDRLRKMIDTKVKPVFGICLGHQLLALAAGAKTKKLKFGNRGHNIPCTDMQTGRCHITSQNHGYAVDVETLPTGWRELFVNANDGSNEGIFHETLPYFSVQFHPESTPGPRDTEYLFDRFISVVKGCVDAGKLVSLDRPAETQICKPQRVTVSKVLILGSGGLSIGQAGEFDYSGSQAIKALKEEGIYTVLINPNIATIQTSKGLADKVYFLPVTPEFVRKVIKYEKPDGIYVSFGGQTALNCGVKMKDEFESLGVKVLGTQIETVIITEDREFFAEKMAEINEKCAKSHSATNVKEAIDAANDIGYPLIVRAAYALGGLGSGFASNEKELVELCNKAFAVSPQVLVERSMKGWKEIEYEVVRDINDNCITVCNMENFDPLGIHTGDSIVVAPSQTLSDEDYNMLRTTAVNVVRHLGVVGECNIQYALNPDSKEYCIIEVNARLSRSSALASKATGYPLAFVAAKLGLGIPLSELKNSVTKVTVSCFEPSLDYVVVKIPRWDLRKFNRVSTNIGSAMKSVGEVMAIGRNFEETIQKAIRSIDYHFVGFAENDFVKDIEHELKNPSDKRLFAIANALHSGKYSIEQIWQMTKIDRWFLNKLKHIVDLDKKIAQMTPTSISSIILKQAKQLGFSDRHVARLIKTSEMGVRKIRQDFGVTPFVKQIDTVAAEFPAFTNYLYVTYNAVENDVSFQDNGVMVIGSGVYRIGSSVEFDWCAVRAVRTLRENGFKTIMVNYNPETVSTDYDEADRLYFENITLERVLDIYEIEASAGVIVSVGGQTPNNIALALHRQSVKIFGTSPEQIDGAENRYKFSRMCDTIGVDQPRWKELTSLEEAHDFCSKVGFPVLVRPSYVLSGAAMNVVSSAEDLDNYLLQAVAVSQDHPVVISKFIEEAKEIEMDAIAKDGKMIYHVISEHVENAGVHSGDATLVLPPQDLEPETVRKIEDATRKIGNALNVTGPFNIQFIAKNNEIKVIECNVRASRSFPFASKVLGVDMIELATRAMLNLPFEAYPPVNVPKSGYVCIKVPQFSFGRLSGADPVLGVEMASTGEVACFGHDKYEAYLKALLSTGFVLPKKNILLSIGSFKEKQEFLPSVWKLHRLGFNLFATSGTADFMNEHGIPVKVLESFEGHNSADRQKAEYDLQQHLSNNLIDLYINLPSKNKYRRPASYMSKGYRTRRMAVDLSVPLITNVKCAKLFVEALARKPEFQVSKLDYQTSHRLVSMPGLINVGLFVPNLASITKEELDSVTASVAASGFTASIVLGYGTEGSLESSSALETLRGKFGRLSSDLILSVAPKTADAKVDATAVVMLDFEDERTPTDMSQLMTLIKSWPSSVRLVVRASGARLASVVFMANMLGRPVHVTSVFREEDIQLIALSKSNNVNVTCDVAIYNLFLTRDQVAEAATVLGTQLDIEALWKNLQHIDCFSTNATPYLLAKAAGKADQMARVVDGLPLLMTAVSEGRLTVEDVKDRLYHNPRRIFDLPEQPDTAIELELDRRFVATKDRWTPFAANKIQGNVCRVILRGRAVFIDGAFVDGYVADGKEVVLAPRAMLSPIKTDKPRRASKAPTELIEPLTSAKISSLESLEEEPTEEGVSEREKRLQVALQKVEQIEKTIHSKERDMSLERSVPPEISRTLRTSFFRQHILNVKQFTRAELHVLFNAAHEMRTIVERHGTVNLLAGRVLCNLFYEPSTRTSASFESAMLRLGGQVISVTQNMSSIQKGESLADTVRTVGCYTDAIVVRHPDVGSAQLAAKYSKIPVINAGDGTGEHPTQAFLDVYTIREELGTVNGLTVTIVGDLKHGRTVHSLVKLLSMYDVRINYVSPESLRMPEDLVSDLRKVGLQQTEFRDLNPDLIARTDVLYVTRIQQERFPSKEEYEKFKNSYCITNSTLTQAKPNMIVMHPLPRVNEIDPEVDFDQRAAYFRQMKYGLYVRMALLALVLGK